MKSLIFISLFFLSVQSFAFEVICTCAEPCTQVVFEVEESDLGTIMTVDTISSQTQGPATVSVSKVKDQTFYKLGNFSLLKIDGEFKMLGSDRVCSMVVLPR